jgi:hypothetical protein
VSVLERQPVLRESGLELLRVEFGLALKIFTRGLLLPQGEGRRDAFCEREGFGFRFRCRLRLRFRCGWLAGTAGTAMAGRGIGEGEIGFVFVCVFERAFPRASILLGKSGRRVTGVPLCPFFR